MGMPQPWPTNYSIVLPPWYMTHYSPLLYHSPHIFCTVQSARRVEIPHYCIFRFWNIKMCEWPEWSVLNNRHHSHSKHWISQRCLGHIKSIISHKCVQWHPANRNSWTVPRKMPFLWWSGCEVQVEVVNLFLCNTLQSHLPPLTWNYHHHPPPRHTPKGITEEGGRSGACTFMISPQLLGSCGCLVSSLVSSLGWVWEETHGSWFPAIATLSLLSLVFAGKPEQIEQPSGLDMAAWACLTPQHAIHEIHRQHDHMRGASSPLCCFSSGHNSLHPLCWVNSQRDV